MNRPLRCYDVVAITLCVGTKSTPTEMVDVRLSLFVITPRRRERIDDLVCRRATPVLAQDARPYTPGGCLYTTRGTALQRGGRLLRNCHKLGRMLTQMQFMTRRQTETPPTYDHSFVNNIADWVGLRTVGALHTLGSGAAGVKSSRNPTALFFIKKVCRVGSSGGHPTSSFFNKFAPVGSGAAGAWSDRNRAA